LFLWRSTGRQKFSVGQCSVDLFCEDGFARQGLDVDQYVHGTILHIVESVEELGPSSKLELTFLGVLPLADFHHASGRGTGGTAAKTTILCAGALMVLSGGIAMARGIVLGSGAQMDLELGQVSGALRVAHGRR
jgi:hypothetical protein